jgi:hypothetical protein
MKDRIESLPLKRTALTRAIKAEANPEYRIITTLLRRESLDRSLVAKVAAIVKVDGNDAD